MPMENLEFDLARKDALWRMNKHHIGYAYPTSDIATQLKFRDGCFYYESGLTTIGFSSYQEALEHATVVGTNPSRFSMDHPKNQHFLYRQCEDPIANSKAVD